MNPIEERIVPASHRAETRGVLIASLVLFFAWGGLLFWLRVPPPASTLGAHQQSAFQILTPLEQGFFNDLRTAALEIKASFDEDGKWPTVPALAALALPPFAQDPVWSKRGRHLWLHYTSERPGHALYRALPGNLNAGEWLLHWEGDKTRIWRRPFSAEGKVPRAEAESLPREGWTEIVAQEPTTR